MTETLGSRVKELRDARGWSLREAAARMNVSKSMLSKIENGLTSPTATILGRVAEGFGFSISQLIGGAERAGDVIVLPRAEQPVFRVPTSGFERRSLSPFALSGSRVDFVVNTLPPKQSSGTFPAHRSGVEETLVVASGRLRLLIADTHYDLSAGDSVFYRADVPHRFDNLSDSEAAIFYIAINNEGPI